MPAALAERAASLTERTAAFRAAARRIHEIEVSDRAEADRLAEIRDILVALSRRVELFPPSAFPRAPGSSGGLFHLAHSPDGRGGIYVSLGFTGRGGGAPHTHASWAAVVGVSGGVETNYVYEKTGDDQFELKEEVVVGPGDAILLPTGAYHTIAVVSETPVLHVHAYGQAVGRPGSRPLLPVLEFEEARTEAEAGNLAIVTLAPTSADAPSGPHVLTSTPQALVAELASRSIDRNLPVALVAAEEVAGEAAARLYEAGYPVVFRLQDAYWRSPF